MGKNKNVRIRVVGHQRQEPDARRIAKAIIRLALDGQEMDDKLADLEAAERHRVRARRAVEPPDREAS